MNLLPRSKGTAGALAVLLMISALSGCDWHSDGATALEGWTPDVPPQRDPGQTPSETCCPCATCPMDPGPPEMAPVECGATGDGPMVGRWVLETNQYGVFAPLGADYDITITSWFLVDIGADDPAVRLTFCDERTLVDADGDFEAFRTEVPETVRNMDYAGPWIASPCGMVPSQTIVWIWGLLDPDQDPLPATPDDAGHCDQDNDGNPGITIEVKAPLTGMRYTARRVTLDISAAAEIPGSPGEWGGDMEFQVEESALGATSPMLKTIVPIRPKDGATSTYRFRRTEVTDCAALLSSLQ